VLPVKEERLRWLNRLPPSRLATSLRAFARTAGTIHDDARKGKATTEKND